MKLTEEQAAEIKAEMVPNGVPVRFLKNGCCYILGTGETMPRGINVINQMVYWNFTKETSQKIAQWLDLKPVFCE